MVRDLIRGSCAQPSFPVLIEGFHEDCLGSLKPITFLVGELKQVIQLLDGSSASPAVWDAVRGSRLPSLPMAFSSKL
jgi:hypothetical protein